MQQSPALRPSFSFPLLVVVLGLPGTGKTTFARMLAQRLGALHFNTDIIREELGLKGQYGEVAKQRVYQSMEARARAALQKKQAVVVDGTFFKPALRKPYQEMAAALGLPACWIQLEASDAIVKERVAQKRKHSEADYSVYLRIRDAWAPLETEHLKLSSEESLETMVEKALSFLQIQNSGP